MSKLHEGVRILGVEEDPSRMPRGNTRDITYTVMDEVEAPDGSYVYLDLGDGEKHVPIYEVDLTENSPIYELAKEHGTETTRTYRSLIEDDVAPEYLARHVLQPSFTFFSGLVEGYEEATAETPEITLVKHERAGQEVIDKVSGAKGFAGKVHQILNIKESDYSKYNDYTWRMASDELEQRNSKRID